MIFSCRIWSRPRASSRSARKPLRLASPLPAADTLEVVEEGNFVAELS